MVVNTDTKFERFLSKIGQTDYIQDGVLHYGGNTPSILVTGESDLSLLPDCYPPGTIAYTAGFKAMWQLDAAGKWVAML